LIYLFENCSLDPDRRELRRGPDPVAIEPQVFDVLLYLIRHRERVVSKGDLIASVWNGRIVSDCTLSSRIAAVRRAVGDRGDEQRLIRTVVRKGLRFIGDVIEEKQTRTANVAAAARYDIPSASALSELQIQSLAERPSIAVIPFENISGDPEQECLIDGMREDITTALSQFRLLSVIVRNSRLRYDGRVVEATEVGRELGVRYVLDGSVRKAEDRVRIITKLIDVATGVNVCACRFEGKLDDVFDLQDKVTTSVVGVIAPKLEQAEIERAKRRSGENLDAYQCYLLGMGSLYQWTRDGISNALRLFQKALEIDPEFAAAYGMAAYCYVQRKSYGWFTDRAQEIAESAELARHAVELAGDDAVALTRAAHAIASVVGDVDSGLVFIEQALRQNPNLSAAWYVSGWMRMFLGQPELAAEHLTLAMQLSPFHPLTFKMQSATAYAHLLVGRYDDASTAAENALRVRPNYLTAVRGAAASHALAGRLDRARTLMAHMCQRDPALHISNLPYLIPFRRTADFARWAEGLNKAGLPD
jgi:TolB-like protein/tetratricopeptide (TPR) repeat protein